MPRIAIQPFLFFLFLFSPWFVRAQPTRAVTEPQGLFWQAREHFQAGRWSLAYPMFLELRRGLSESDRAARQTMADEIDFYTTAAALRQNEPLSLIHI